jgi:prepilin-type N-terminal cleavage/methylation domain-containing protein
MKKNIKKYAQGFTLIELLVVVALLGIMATIVMAALNSTKTSSEDTSIQANINKLQTQAELYYSNNNNYGANTLAYSSVCPTTAVASTTAGVMGVSGTGLLAFTTAIVKQAGSANTLCTVSANGTKWAVAARFKGDTTKVICADSTGKSKISVTALASSITNAVCN